MHKGMGRADRDPEGGESGARGGGEWGLWIGMAFDPVDFSFHRRDEVRGVLRSLLEGSWVILGPLKGWTWTPVPLVTRLYPCGIWRKWTGLESIVLRPPNHS